MTDVWRHADSALAEEYDFLARTTARERYADLLALLPRQRDRALDVGCGTGVLASRLAGEFRRVVGIDISPAMIAVARRGCVEHRRDNVDLVLADMQALPFTRSAFDLVVSTAAIHYARIAETLAVLQRLVRPGGRLIVSSVVARHPRLHASPLVEAAGLVRSVPGYLRAYGPAATRRLVRFRISAGWRRIRFTGHPPTREQFRDACVRALPEGTIREPSPWSVTTVWEAPR